MPWPVARFVLLLRLFFINVRIRIDLDLPPAKRRRTLAGSIVSTAVSAALIGTAVGLTVYRLWRDRGRDTLPPPPYEESESRPSQDEPRPQISITTSSPRRRPRPTAGRRSAILKHRKTHSRSHPHSPPRSISPGTSTAPSGPFDFQFGQEQPETRADDEPEDEMDWIGDRISKLIEEGKKSTWYRSSRHERCERRRGG